MINDLQVYILLAVTAVLLLCLAMIAKAIFKKYEEKIMRKIK